MKVSLNMNLDQLLEIMGNGYSWYQVSMMSSYLFLSNYSNTEDISESEWNNFLDKVVSLSSRYPENKENILKLSITASTSYESIEAAIPFLDMRDHAFEQREMAAAVLDEQGDQVVLELCDIHGVVVLYSPVFGYAYVNEVSTGIGNSLLIGNGQAKSPQHAAQLWLAQ